MTGLATAFGSTATATLHVEGSELDVRVDGEDLGLLIGPGGRTLMAVQDLARVAAQRRLGDHDTRLRIDVVARRVVQRQAGARHRQIHRREREARVPLLGPAGRALEIQELDDERRGLLVRAPLAQRQQQAAGRGHARPDRLARERRAPQDGLRRQRDRQEAALVVPDGVSRAHEQLAVLAEQRVVARFLDVGHEHRLRDVTRHVHGQRPRRAAGERREPERDHGRGFVSGDDVAEVRCVRRLEAPPDAGASSPWPPSLAAPWPPPRS